ncbi:MAG: penicillin-binding protein activator [Pseudomonadota bacterium]|nr:penicillin-binding protein activator [Pseudomonadota bacterium]
MRLLSTLPAPSEVILLAVAITIFGCQDTGTNGARNAGVRPVLAIVDSKQASNLAHNSNPKPQSVIIRPVAPKLAAPAPEPVIVRSVAPKVAAPAPEPVIIRSVVPKLDTQMTKGPAIKISHLTPKFNEVRVGLLLPLTGQGAFLGKTLFDAAILALFSKKTENFVLMPFDTQSSKEGAAAAAHNAVQAGIKLAIGPIFSDAVTGAAPVFQNAGIKVIALSNNQAVAEPGIFLAGLFPQAQIKRLLEYASKKGKNRLAVLVPTGPYGTRIVGATRSAVSAAGIKLVRIEKYGESEEDIARAVRALSNYNERRASLLDQISILKKQGDEGSQRALARLQVLETLGTIPFDSLLVVASGSALVNVGAQLGNFDVDTKRVQLLGLGGWGSNKTGAEPPLVGSWFATIPFHADDNFSRNYVKTYGSKPHPLGTTVYDLVALAAIMGPKDGSKYNETKLTAKTGFSGASGLFRFLDDGRSEHSLEVREILPRGSKLIDPAQTRFSPEPK